MPAKQGLNTCVQHATYQVDICEVQDAGMEHGLITPHWQAQALCCPHASRPWTQAGSPGLAPVCKLHRCAEALPCAWARKASHRMSTHELAQEADRWTSLPHSRRKISWPGACFCPLWLGLCQGSEGMRLACQEVWQALNRRRRCCRDAHVKACD